ncbi:MAG: T9SS type A sorting domain-containing protein, partial [Ignavibacteriales bacterium]|nr:T9SS type A sorting domain-containing protein [Ignavibacteriales bacterium]
SYLIYAEYYADALHASFCSRTIELSRAAYDIAQLGPPMPLGIREENVAPATYLLSQNYPNPFNPVTTIRFEVPASGFVSLKVFNLLGEEIVTVVSEQLYPGTYTRQWNADKVASGVYYYRLSTRQQESGQADIFSETKKLILLK